MARTVRWTETAIEDLDEATGFIARDSRYYAAAFVREVRGAARSLDFSPERGRVVPEVDRTDIREIFVKSHRLIYQVTNRQVFILAFIHGARNLAFLWERRADDYRKTNH
uniref:Plasmid stabilization system protein ParE n=1 Tax=Candidatus Kentrum sp. DK TaxID=2126562 RepID=A0A450TBJ6_9GAMM|nr:MAG: Plasmid stabilization system protein ParE [Candidatus Kentron sp. DK]